jgi:glycosyltransferase involved in cell wall biosynthesis
MSNLRLAVICDYLEEDWPSMDLCSQMLLKHLQVEQTKFLQSSSICPKLRQRFQRIPKVGKKQAAFNRDSEALLRNADRLLNRFWDYPHYLSKQVNNFDLFHVSDHTYAQLVHVLPPERTGVFCHDLDAFRSLFAPEQEPRPGWYKAMSERILKGLQKAAVVFYSTEEVRKQIEYYGLVNPSNLVHAPYGISSEFSVTPTDTIFVDEDTLQQIGTAPFILHVGSCIPRKRIDVLLEVFACLRIKHRNLRLVKVSGDWTDTQQEQIHKLGIVNSIIHLKGLQRTTIAALYRQASVVLLTSESEGFGLPVIEALACGAMIVVSDIPVLREVGGAGAIYCPIEDISTWIKTVEQLLENPRNAPSLDIRMTQVQKYSWSAHTQIIAQTYLQLAG